MQLTDEELDPDITFSVPRYRSGGFGSLDPKVAKPGVLKKEKNPVFGGVFGVI